MKRIMTQLLNLSEVVVESSLEEGKILILSVSKKAKNAVCPQCGQKKSSSTHILQHSQQDLKTRFLAKTVA
jgi:hypothetical protein